MRCGACGRDNRAGRRFCGGCGAALELACPGCGAANEPDERFCGDCGAGLTPDASPAPTEAAPTHESRKVVTILFADLAGSTSLQEHLDAESARRVMERFYTAMRTALEAHDGHVVKFTGDGVMAVFGVPQVREDDALRALRAAHEMHDAFTQIAADLSRERGATVGMRIGINTGEVVVSEGDDDVVGDAVNVAARLEHAAANGDVLVGEETWRVVRDKVTLEAVEPLELKGKSEPVPAYRVVSLEPRRTAIASRFVGRDAEIARLTSVFEDALDAGRARLATVLGSPGLGKTRLARELGASLATRAQSFEARCETAGVATFAPIADVIRIAASIGDEAAPDDVLAALVALLPDDEPEREKIAAHVASILGVGEPVSPQELFWAVRRVIESVARRTPLLLILDDVHWAEPMLLDLIDYLAEWTRDAPVLLLALARPELRESRPAFVDIGGRTSAVVVLEGLDAQASVRLAGDLLQTSDLPSSLVERLLASSEGNPLFLGELVRMLTDDGVLRRDGERLVVTVDASEIDLPPTINALLSARIERLRADERVVVERAAVIGKEFYRGAVAALTPAPVATGLDGHLETLRRKELVEPEGSYWIDEPVFRFHHVLIRDAAYRRLLKEARAELHERFAEWLERKVGTLVGEHGEVIGYHLEQAHEYLRQLGGNEDRRRELGTRASEFLAAAGRRALERDDLGAAEGLIGRALERLDEPAAELLVDRCEALLSMGDVATAGPLVEELRRLAAGSGRLEAWTDCFAAQVTNLVDPTHLEETVERVASAAARFVALSDKAGAAKAYSVHAETLARLGRMAECEAALDRALAAAREAGDRRRANAVLAGAPVAALWGPSPVTRASGRCLDVVRVLRITAGAPAVEATALRCQAALEAFRGREEAARTMIQSARATLEELGLRHALLETDVFAALVELQSGNGVAAEPYLRTAFEGLTDLGADADAGYAAALLARALWLQNRFEEAEAITHQSERLGGNDLKTSIAWRNARAAALARRGEVDEALRLAREAVALAEPTDALVFHADTRRAYAIVLREAGMEAVAQAEVARAIELYERKGATSAAERARQFAGAAPVPREPEEPLGVSERKPGAFVAPGVIADDWIAFWERMTRAAKAYDWVAFADLYASDDVVIVDRRAGLQNSSADRDANVAAWRDMLDGRDFDVRCEVLATRGRLGLSRHTLWADDDSGAFETDRLILGELDDGRVSYAEHFDVTQLDFASARLDELAAERSGRGGVRHAPGVRRGPWTDLLTTARERMIAKNWDGFAALLHPDVRLVDHRSGVRHETAGRETNAAAWRDAFGSNGADIDVEIIATRGDRCALAHVVALVLDDTGSVLSQIPRTIVYEFTDGLVLRAESFDATDLAGARARLNGLGGWEPRVACDPDDAAFAIDLWTRLRTALVRKDWNEFVALYRDDATITSLQSGQRYELDRDGYVASVKDIYDREVDLDVEILEACYPYVLATCRFIGPGDEGIGPWEIVRISVGQADGTAVAAVWFFDEGELDDAKALYDERVRGEDRVVVRVAPGVEPGTWVEKWERFLDFVVARDWEGAMRTARPDLRVSLRFRGVHAEMSSAAEYIASVRSMFDGAHRWELDILDTRSDEWAVVRAAAFGVGEDGTGPWDIVRIAVVRKDADGLTMSSEMYDESDIDLARARLDELAPRGPRIGVRLALALEASRDAESMKLWFERWRSAIVSHDWATFDSLYSTDLVYASYMSGLRSGTQGRDAYIASMRETFGREHDWDIEILDVRGPFVLARMLGFGPGDDRSGPWEIGVRIAVGRIEGGIARLIETFDEANAESAHARFAELTGTGRSTVRVAPGVNATQAFVDLTRHISDAILSHDWDALRALLAPNFTMVSRQRGLQFEMASADEWIDSTKQIYAQLRDIDVEYLAERGDWALTRNRFAGAGGGDDAGPWDNVRLLVSQKDAGGRWVSAELFDDDDLDAARGRFDELASGSEDAIVRSLLDTTATRVFERRLEAWRARDWDAFAAFVSKDYVGDDRINHRTVTGREESLENNRAFFELGVTDTVGRPIAVRGDRLALCRWSSWGGTDDSRVELAHLGIFELDDDGLISRLTVFDGDDLDAALTELRERDLVLHPHLRPHIAASVSLADALQARDTARVASAFTPDALVIDHRPASLPTMNTAEYAESVAVLFDVSPTHHAFGAARLGVVGDASLWLTSNTGTVLGGDGSFETQFFTLYRVADGRVAELEMFSLGQLDAARARLEKVGSRMSDDDIVRSLLDTPAARLLERRFEAWRTQDWQAFAALTSKDYVADDRVNRLAVHGQDQPVENYRVWFDLGLTDGAVRVIAVRGDRLVLSTSETWGGTEDSRVEVAHLRLLETNEDGLLSRLTVFDGDDLDAALAELRERDLFLHPHLRPHLETLYAYTDAFVANDWTVLSATVTPDALVVDHRPASFGTVAAEAWISSIRSLFELAPSHRVVGLARIDATTEVSLWLVRQTGTLEAGGGEYEYYVLHLYWTIDGRFKRKEFFPLNQIDHARARFRELSGLGGVRVAEGVNAERSLPFWRKLRRVVVERDWEGLRAMCRPDTRMLSEQQGLQLELTNRDEIVDWVRAIYDREVDIEAEIIAESGCRFAVWARTFGPGDDATGPWETARLICHELDDDGLAMRARYFDESDRDTALAWVHQPVRVASGVESPERAIAVFERLRAALLAEDWDAARAVFAPDFTSVSRQSGLRFEIDGDEYMEMQRLAAERSRSLPEYEAEILAGRDGWYVCRYRHFAADDEWEAKRLMLCRIDEHGLIARTEIYDEHDLEAAFARLDAVASPARIVRANPASRVLEMIDTALDRGDTDVFARSLADDYVRIGSPGIRRTRDEAIAEVHFDHSAGRQGSMHVLATLGRHHALTSVERVVMATPIEHDFGLSASTFYGVVRIGRDDKLVRAEYFREGELHRALRRLGEMYGEDELGGAIDASVQITSAYHQLFDAYAVKEWARFGDVLATDCRFVDRRPTGMGALDGRDAVVEAHVRFTDLAPNRRTRITDVLALEGNVCAIEITVDGVDASGGAFEISLFEVGVLGPLGTFAHREWFAPEERSSALERFREFTA